MNVEKPFSRGKCSVAAFGNETKTASVHQTFFLPRGERITGSIFKCVKVAVERLFGVKYVQ